MIRSGYQPDSMSVGSVHEHVPTFIFAAFGGWDAYGAKKFGYATYWCNRFNVPLEKLGTTPDATAADFAGLLRFVLAD